MKPLLYYPGAKWSIAKQIVARLPTHNTYLEPFFGSGAVFFNKYPSNLETINDMDKRVVNFFFVCRQHPEELKKAIQFTPYARDEYNSVLEKKSGDLPQMTGDPVEDARRFLVRCNMSFGSKLSDKAGWKNSKKATAPDKAKSWAQLPLLIDKVTERLKQAQIECKPAVELIKQYNNPDCLIYADPPYLLSTRTRRLYSFEMEKEEQHKELLQALLKHKGSVVLSGYENELYNDMLKDWEKVHIASVTNSGKSTTEILWINTKEKQLKLF